MENILEKMIAQLSEKDQIIFSKISKKFNEVDGDISQLSEKELSLIKSMEEKYSDKLSNFDQDIKQNDSINDLLETGFASYARQLLARDLNARFPNEEDAVKFAFQNRWVPQEFKDPNTAIKIFDDYKNDICDANQWREEVVGIESDKSMAAGMTWFMVVFQLNQKLN